MSWVTDRAKEIATRAHEGQTRWDKKTPYISHPAAVAAACEKHGHICVAIAWLHDVIEDTSVSRLDLLDAGIPFDVAEAVLAMTKRDGDDYLSYLLRVKQNGLAVVVKMEDIKHNMSCFPEHQRRGAKYQKYQLALYILEQGN